jgi:hypothetical protein
MYEFKDESERKETKFKIYLVLFVISVLINTFIDFFRLGIEEISKYRIVFSLLIYVVIFYFGLRRKLWAEFIIKIMVWLNIILLFIIIVVSVLGL